MKPLLWLVGISILFYCAGCKKSAAEKAVRKSIVGTWELRRISGQTLINYAPRNGNTLQFTASAYERHANGARTENGTYKIVRDNSVDQNTCLVMAGGQYENRIDFSGDMGRKIFLQFSNDTLHLVAGCFADDSGSFSDYVRVENAAPTE